MTIAAVIVAAGAGLRAGGERPKQYQKIGGKPVIMRTLEAFASHPRISRIIAVIREEHLDYYREAVSDPDIAQTVYGGSTRQESCRIGIEALAARPPKAVLIHDGARPFAPHALIDRVVAALAVHDGVIPGLPISDTLKRAPGGIVQATLDRSHLWSVQTPQGFAFQAIHGAHRQAAASGMTDLTDDAAVAELAGIEVAMVAGSPENRKLTTSADMADADRTQRQRRFDGLPDIRVGQGVDIHAFEPGNGVILCGVTIPYGRKLQGHSDADAALHALTDAILGAIGEGDIGTHFPPTDPTWEGAASRIFLAKAAGLVSARGGLIAHADLTILAQEPRIGPYVVAMRERVCGILDLTPDRVAIKATTTEQMGFIGRGDGLAAFATATIRLPA